MFRQGLVVPDMRRTSRRRNQAFPDRPYETHKAWREQVHRFSPEALALVRWRSR